jgi:hypothetical protein
VVVDGAVFSFPGVFEAMRRSRPTDSIRTPPYITGQGGAVPGCGRPSNHKPGEEIHMNAARIVGIILIVGGLAAFFAGGFSFNKNTTAAKIGTMELTVTEKKSVNIPQWLSLGAIALGAIVLVMGSRKL